jgi:hypothetical protein
MFTSYRELYYFTPAGTFLLGKVMANREILALQRDQHSTRCFGSSTPSTPGPVKNHTHDPSRHGTVHSRLFPDSCSDPQSVCLCSIESASSGWTDVMLFHAISDPDNNLFNGPTNLMRAGTAIDTS